MNKPDSYVHVSLTPREAKIASWVLSEFEKYGQIGSLDEGIADYFKLDVRRVYQIVDRAKRKIDFARAKMATQAADKPCTVHSQEDEDES